MDSVVNYTSAWACSTLMSNQHLEAVSFRPTYFFRQLNIHRRAECTSACPRSAAARVRHSAKRILWLSEWNRTKLSIIQYLQALSFRPTPHKRSF